MACKCDINKSGNSANACSEDMSNPEGLSFWKRQAVKIKNKKFTCPLCREVFTGLSAMGAHLKDHCT